jgi:hypothetical protein
MSYTSSSAEYLIRFSALDIAALHYLYGPSQTARTGNDTYNVSTSEPNFIWDGAGIDTISASTANAGCTIYLTPGYWGYTGSEKAARITSAGQITVNFGTVIENLVGSAFSDALYGNSAANSISGGAGDDTILGGAGDDTLDGGAGVSDTAVFSGAISNYSFQRRDGTDSIAVTDRTAGRDGADLTTGFEYFRFADGTKDKAYILSIATFPNVTWTGTSGPDVYTAGSGSDSLSGLGGGDSLSGGAGNDLIDGGANDDTLNGGAGDDQLTGGDGLDTAVYSGTSGGYRLLFSNNTLRVQDRTGTDGTDTLIQIERLQFNNKSVIVESRAHSGFSDIPASMYQFFILAFGAAPGVEYLQQCADAYRAGASMRVITSVFTTKSQFTDSYPISLSNRELASKLVSNVVGNSASDSSKAQAIIDISAALDGGLSVGNMIFTVFSNLAAKPLSGDEWSGTAKLFQNQIAVAKYYTETMGQSTTDVATLRAAISAVTPTSDVSTESSIVSLVGIGLLGV